MITMGKCWRIKCLFRLQGCKADWLGEDRDELWCICAKCDKPRFLLTSLTRQKST